MPSPSTLESDAEGSVVESSPEVAPAPAEPAPAEPAPAEKKKKQKPVGVTVEERKVAVGGNLVPMADKHQTRVPWKE